MVAQHTDRTTYVAWVLWLIGMSQTSIARVLLMRRKQIAGIVDRSPYAKRSAMSDMERQHSVDELVAVRFDVAGQPIDGGILDPIPMKIIQLRSKQRKRKAS